MSVAVCVSDWRMLDRRELRRSQRYWGAASARWRVVVCWLGLRRLCSKKRICVKQASVQGRVELGCDGLVWQGLLGRVGYCLSVSDWYIGAWKTALSRFGVLQVSLCWAAL